jgi:hypothetical protein
VALAVLIPAASTPIGMGLRIDVHGAFTRTRIAVSPVPMLVFVLMAPGHAKLTKLGGLRAKIDPRVPPPKIPMVADQVDDASVVVRVRIALYHDGRDSSLDVARPHVATGCSGERARQQQW